MHVTTSAHLIRNQKVGSRMAEPEAPQSELSLHQMSTVLSVGTLLVRLLDAASHPSFASFVLSSVVGLDSGYLGTVPH